MRTKYTVPLKTVAKELGLKPLHLSADYENAVLSMSEINRPALQLSGFYNYFDPKRMQAIGKVETTYLETLTHEERLKAFEQFMTYDIAALVICHGCKTFPECRTMAERFDRNVFYTDEETSTAAGLDWSLLGDDDADEQPMSPARQRYFMGTSQL